MKCLYSDVIVFVPSVAAVQMESAEYTVNEDAGSVWVCVELTSLPAGGLECDISVTLVTMDGAKAGGCKNFSDNQSQYLSGISCMSHSMYCV